MAGRHLVELGEDRLLDLHPLGGGLDDEVDVAERAVVGGPLDPAHRLGEPLLGLLRGELLLLDELVEPALGDLAGLLQAMVDELHVDVLEDDIDVGGGDRLGDLTAHGSGADDCGLEDEHLSPIVGVLEACGSAAEATEAAQLPAPPPPVPVTSAGVDSGAIQVTQRQP